MANSTIEKNRAAQRSVVKSYGTYLRGLFGLEVPALTRAADPFMNHAWVYASAMSAAMNVAQVPFNIYRETDDVLNMRRAKTKNWLPSAGNRRKAMIRYQEVQRKRRMCGFQCKGLEIDENHDLNQVLRRPNELMDSYTFWQVHMLWNQLRGGLFWVLLANDGERPLSPGEVPQEIWPVSPDLMQPLTSGGQLTGWSYTPTMNRSGFVPVKKQTFLPHEVIAFRKPDLKDPLGFFSPLTAAASSIANDLAAIQHNKELLDNDAEPGGVLMFPDDVSPTDEETLRFVRQFEERHEGPGNTRRTAVLYGGVKYMPTSLSPRDMEYHQQREWNRDEELAVMKTPKTVLGITESVNYATQLGQDKNYWEKNLIPEMLGIERTLDGTLFYNSTDSTVGLFDTSAIEALRAGLSDKVAIAMNLSGQVLRVPPEIAFEQVGLEIEDYAGSDQVFIPAGLTTVEAALEAIANPPSAPVEPAPANPLANGGQTGGEDDEDAPVGGNGLPASTPPGSALAAKRKAAAKRGRAAIDASLDDLEAQYKGVWKAWLKKARTAAIEKFDDATSTKGLVLHAKAETPPPEAVLSTADLLGKLNSDLRKVHAQQLEQIFTMTSEELGGITTFAIDDPAMLAVLNNRTKSVGTRWAQSVQDQLNKTLADASQNGETVQEMRDRVGEVFDIASGGSKSLQIARTESGATFNQMRNTMFEKQGFTKFKWSTSGDEHVREDHRAFEASGPQEADFNYMTLIGEPGTCRYPHDPEAPASQVVNCRCVQLPVE